MWQRHRVPRHALSPICRLGFRRHLRPLTMVPASFQTAWRSALPLCVKASSPAIMLDSQCLDCATPRCARKSAELSLTVPRRTAFLVGVAALTSAVCLLCAAASLQLLWVAAPLAGFAFGCHWSLMPPLASELFGLRSFATLYCLLQSATTFGTYAFATKLVHFHSPSSLQPESCPMASLWLKCSSVPAWREQLCLDALSVQLAACIVLCV